MKILFTTLLFIELCSLCNAFAMRPFDETGEVKEEVHERKRRSFHSYYYNYYDEIATSICSSLPGSIGWTFPIRRTCGGTTTCSTICADPKLKKQGGVPANKKWSCTESLHIYKKRPTLAENYNAYTDSSKMGLVVYRYHSCVTSSCGPNYCCCRAY